MLDSNLSYVAPQPIAGGTAVTVEVTSSNSSVGTIKPSTVSIEAGGVYAESEFQPVSAGETMVKVSVPPGFSTPAPLGTLPTTVVTPGIAVTSEATIGQNLQIAGSLSLGEPAPAGGVTVTLTSKDPKRLLLSLTATAVGSESIKLTIPPRGFSSPYYLQALADSGTESYVASAPGYRSRTGTITLAPSGMVMGGPQGPPDEAELFRKEEADNIHGFVTKVGGHPTAVTVFAAQLDPKTGRAADLTVQSMRPGVSAAIILKSSNSSVGRLDPPELVIQPGTDRAITNFIPAGAGSTDISIISPPGFGKAQNATSLRVIVKE
jgi:hypothetical protein